MSGKYLWGCGSLLLILSCFWLGLLLPARGDTPANCTYQDVVGTWMFSLGPGNNDRSVNCSNFTVNHQVKFRLVYPDVALDEFNNRGFWTLIYNQGFEVVVAGRKYFGFSYYAGSVSYCDTVEGGWSHDLLGHDWACYNGKKSTSAVKVRNDPKHVDKSLKFKHGVNSLESVTSINKVQKLWTAVKYPQFENLSRDDLMNLAGGRASIIFSRPKPAALTPEHQKLMASLPESFDWRDLGGVNFVSPVRNQGSCGSCYAFGSLAMDEARVRILTNNTRKPVFSTQDVVECSQYSQGCSGGFPYLVSGKYGEDFGLVLEACNPYRGSDGKCQTKKNCARHYFTGYKYIGGYYGACNEALMMEALYYNGPIAVSFEVYDDFFNYKSGIYTHNYTIGDAARFNPFEITNHVVAVVGWGRDSVSGEKYWIVKNSWGDAWGVQGYFSIRRGTDECGIESIAVESTPILTFNSV